MKYLSKSEKETFNFAKKYAKQLRGGEVLCLVGDLGAGKTAFTKGLAAGLGIKNIITSPTFVIMKNYLISSPLPKGKLGGVTLGPKNIKHLAHIDAYRLSDGDQLLGIGVEDFFEQADCITVIEWADRVHDIWPKKAIQINFKILKGDQREIKIK